MSLVYRYFCDSCGRDYKEALEACEFCGSHDITHAVAYGQVEFNDAEDNARLEEIRAENAERYAVMDTLIEVAMGNYDVPAYSEGFLKVRQAS
jgi:RNA polymerase subunit RPABC4/transcription elongation factor Spt4